MCNAEGKVVYIQINTELLVFLFLKCPSYNVFHEGRTNFFETDNVNKVDKCVGAKICFLIICTFALQFCLEKEWPQVFPCR